KIGQALAGMVAGYALAYTGYQTGAGEEVVQQTAETISGIFTVSTLGPAVGYLISAIFVALVYPLDKDVKSIILCKIVDNVMNAGCSIIQIGRASCRERV